MRSELVDGGFAADELSLGKSTSTYPATNRAYAELARCLEPTLLLAKLHEPTASNHHRKHETDEI
jgi:hypothetical protein